MLPCPNHLRELARATAEDEATGALRHDLRNKLASIRNSVFYVRRKVEKATTLVTDDARVSQFFALIESEIDGCTQILSGAVKARPRTLAAVDLGELVARLVQALALPKGVAIERLTSSAACVAQADEREIELALFSMLESVIAPIEGKGGSAIEIGSSRLDPEWAALTVFASTPRSGVVDQSLSVARRLATQSQGTLDIAEEPRGVRITLRLPAADGQRRL